MLQENGLSKTTSFDRYAGCKSDKIMSKNNCGEKYERPHQNLPPANPDRRTAASDRRFGWTAPLIVKRDDQTGLAFGGNKTRKLEFLVAEAPEQGAKMLISRCDPMKSLPSDRCRRSTLWF